MDDDDEEGARRRVLFQPVLCAQATTFPDEEGQPATHFTHDGRKLYAFISFMAENRGHRRGRRKVRRIAADQKLAQTIPL